MDAKQTIAELKRLNPGVSIGLSCKVYNGLTGNFWITIYTLPTNQLKLVLLSEIPGNKGPSITNSIEYAARHAFKTYQLEPTNTVVIEYYSQEAHNAEDTFDIAQEANGEVTWKRLNKSILDLDFSDVYLQLPSS